MTGRFSQLNNAHSWAVSILRGGRGLAVMRPRTEQPAQTPILFEFESCPYCRKVREAFCELDLDYISIPSARGSRHRAQVVAEGGKAQFPYLVDPNTDTKLYESEDIIDYLRRTYGAPRSPLWRAFAPINSVASTVASALRPLGGTVKPGLTDRPDPEQRLILYGFEASPYCRKAREALCRLDLPYLSRNVAKKSGNRPALKALGGKVLVPFLVDPNTDTKLYESDDIVAYLEQTYGGMSQR